MRGPLLEEAPTCAEAGLEGLEGKSWLAAYAPAKMPAAAIQQLDPAFNKALAAPDARERFLKLDLEPTRGSAVALQAITTIFRGSP